MKKGVIFYFSYLSTLLMASPTFTVYRDLVVKLDAFGITGFSIVTSITECKRRCLDNEMGCLAANMIPIRRGIYSCEYIGAINPSLVEIIPGKRCFSVVKMSIYLYLSLIILSM